MARGRKPIDLTGRTFGRLTARAITPERARGSVVWSCECVCGRTGVPAAANILTRQGVKCPGCGKKSTDPA